MLEIIALIYLGRKIKREAEDRGLSGILWIVIMVLSWIFSEMLVLVLFVLILGEDQILTGIIPAMLVALGSFFVVRYIMSQQSPKREKELDEYAAEEQKDLSYFR